MDIFYLFTYFFLCDYLIIKVSSIVLCCHIYLIAFCFVVVGSCVWVAARAARCAVFSFPVGPPDGAPAGLVAFSTGRMRPAQLSRLALVNGGAVCLA